MAAKYPLPVEVADLKKITSYVIYIYAMLNPSTTC